jgi:hypothetical protein
MILGRFFVLITRNSSLGAPISILHPSNLIVTTKWPCRRRSRGKCGRTCRRPAATRVSSAFTPLLPLHRSRALRMRWHGCGLCVRSVYQTKRARGPPGWVLLGGALAMTVGGLYLYQRDAHERMYVSEKRARSLCSRPCTSPPRPACRYRDLAKSNEQFERSFVLQALEEQRYVASAARTLSQPLPAPRHPSHAPRSAATAGARRP